MSVVNIRSLTRNLTVDYGNDMRFADPLQERQEPTLKRQIQGVARRRPDRRHGTLPKAFSLLSDLDLSPEFWISVP